MTRTRRCVAASLLQGAIGLLGLIGAFDVAVVATALGDPGPAAANFHDVEPQRERAWRVFERLAGGASSILNPAASGWFSSRQVFPQVADQRDAEARAMEAGSEELIVFTLYNATAFRHIQQHPLDGTRGGRSAASAFPPFPETSAILLTAWWPVAQRGVTAMPVWDPERNPPNPAGNGYLTWKRIVAIDGGGAVDGGATILAAMAGRPREAARRVPRDAFVYVPVDAAMARLLMGDRRSRKAVLIALGRELRPGDSLVLVAIHAIEKQHGAWTWTTSWWHDAPDDGPFARGRPRGLKGPLRNYLMDHLRAEPAEAPEQVALRPCFNPWFEARFPDAGAGGGLSSNCIACHSRAGYPAARFLPIRRGIAAPADVAAAELQFTTDFIWSIPRRVATPRH